MWWRALGFAALLLWPASSFAALAIDATASAVCAGAGTFSVGHTSSGANRAVFIGVSYNRTITPPTDVDYNLADLTEVPSSLIEAGDYNARIYYLTNQSSGAQTARVTFSGSVYDCGFGVVSFTDAHQATPYGTPATNAGTSTTPTVNVSSAADEIVLDTGTILHSGTLSVGAGQASQWNNIMTNGYNKAFGSTETGSATTTMSWSNTSSQFWVMSAVPVKPFVASGSTGAPMLRLNLGGGK